MQSALIIGGDSKIGAALTGCLSDSGVKTYFTSRRPHSRNAIMLDLAEPDHWPELPFAEVVYLCAAVAKLDTCENDPETTFRINVVNMQTLTARLQERGIYVVFLSTSQVFDGSAPLRKADEMTSARNEYGRQKAFFESWMLAQPYPSSVLRLTKVMTEPLSVMEAWKKSLQDGKDIEAFTDLRFSPVSLANTVEALMQLGRDKPGGIFQLSGPRDISYYEAARALAKHLSIDAQKVIPKSAMAAGIKPQFLPLNTTLQPSEIFAHINCTDPLKVLGM